MWSTGLSIHNDNWYIPHQSKNSIGDTMIHDMTHGWNSKRKKLVRLPSL